MSALDGKRPLSIAARTATIEAYARDAAAAVPFLTPEAVSGIAKQQADEAALALLTDTPPTFDAMHPTPGSLPKAARPDHRHPLTTAVGSTNSAVHVTDGNGQATLTFGGISYNDPPHVTPMIVEAADNGAVVWKVVSYIGAAGPNNTVVAPFTGCIIKGYRVTQSLPVLTGISLINLLTGVTALITALSGKPITQAAAGVTFTFSAQRKTVS